MCFTTQQTRSALQLEHRYQIPFYKSETFQPGLFRGFAFPQTPVICNAQPHTIECFQWGLIPSWAKDSNIQKYTLNARFETLSKKPSFKNVLHQRCLVLVDAFYEWKWLDPKGKKKQAYRIQFKNQDVFSLGGLWNSWTNPQTGCSVNTYTLITQEAQGIMRDLHSQTLRMPLILDKNQEALWLNGASVNNAHSFLEGFAVDALT